MKLAVNTLFLLPGEVGGSETYLCETLEAIARGHPGVQLAIITNRENHSYLKERFGLYSQCSFHLLSIRAANRYVRILAEQFRLPFIVRGIRPDWLWSPGYTMPFWAPCRQVVSILDMQYRTHPEDLTPLARWTTHALVRMATRRADLILTISHFSKQEIVHHTRCPPGRIQVTHLGVDPAFAPSSLSASTTPDIRHAAREAPYILSVANSYPHKNLHRLVEAFALVLDKVPHQLVLVGRPRLGEPALEKALSGVPPDRVMRIDGLSREELINIYQSADLFVFPSLYEGFGLPVLEAMMAGVPVVTTRKGSLAEVGQGHVAYVEGADASDVARGITEVLSWPEERRQARIRAARLHAETFTWTETATGTLQRLGP